MSKITLNPKNISKETVILNVIEKNKKINEDTKSILRAAFTTIELSEDLWCGVKNVRISGNFEAVKQAALQFVDTMENACETNDLVFFYIQHGGELLHRDDYFEMARHQIEENSFRIENKDPELMGYFVMNREELNRKKEQEKNNIDPESVWYEAKILHIVINETNLSKVEKVFLLVAIRSDLTQQDYERLGRLIKNTENIDEVKNECLENLNLLENKIKKDNIKFVEIFTGRYLVTCDDYFKMLKSQISELNFSQDRKNPKTYGFRIVNKDEAFNKK